MTEMSDNPTSRANAFLVDLDGVIYVQEKLIPGAIEAIHYIQQKKIPHRFVTNTTSHSRKQLTQRLTQVGIELKPEHLFTAPVAAAEYLRALGNARCYFFTNHNIVEEFGRLEREESKPTHVVIGDVGDGFTYESMNRVFNMVHNGAEIIALQRNRFWITTEGLKLDAGAFIAALEYATGKEASVFGKPSAAFFQQACASLGVRPSEVMMIGDDLKADIEGASAAGLQTLFVRTGKDKNSSLKELREQPDIVMASIADLPEYLKQL